MGKRFVSCQCGEPCQVDGEYPKFFAYCDVCGSDIDCAQYAIDYISSKIDEAEMLMELHNDSRSP